MRRRALVLIAAGVSACTLGVAGAWAGFPDILEWSEPNLVYGSDFGAAAALTLAAAETTESSSPFADPRVRIEKIVVRAKEGVVTTLTAPYSAVYVCVNGGGNVPSAANKTTLVGQLTTTSAFPAAKNGKSTGSLETQPLPSAAEAAVATGFACPAGQVLEFDRVVFSGLVLQAQGGERVELSATLVSASVHGLS